MGPTPPQLTVEWTDHVTGTRGYLVIDRLVRGVASGGLRMRRGCTVAEVTDLARIMSLKEALVHRAEDRYQPFGGAKGGIDLDPADPRAADVLARYLSSLRPLVETQWATGEDLGLRQADLDVAATRAGLRSTVQAALPYVPDGADAGLDRLARAFAVRVGGVGLGDLVGGYGVARVALRAAQAGGSTARGRRAVVQGFGSMGGATARYLAEAGVLVVGIADAEGLVVNEEGLNVEGLLATRSPDGRIDRRALGAGDRELPRDQWLTVPTDVLVTAAVSYAVDSGNAPLVRAGHLVEAANASVTPEAEAALADRGVQVIPDVLANCAANSWWWWTLFGDIEPTADGAFARIRETMDELCAEVLGPHGVARTPREATVDLARRNLESLPV